MPSWMVAMAASCFAAFLIGWILGWIVDQWENRQ